MWKQVGYLMIVGAAVGGNWVGTAMAQIIPDGTLPQNTIVTPEGNSFQIEGGTRAGGNLFHSFTEFGVPTGGEAFFNNAADVGNILSRVTGGKISHIDGLIRANGGANLFLINPSGIVFGPNARLNIGGSFLGSTADSIVFPDGSTFSATNSERPLLTIDIPIGLNFRSSPGAIVNRSGAGSDNVTGLQVLPGQTLALIGGKIENEGGQISGPGSRVELGGLTETGTVGLGSDWSLSFPLSGMMADVSFTEGSAIDVSGGSIAINAGNVEIIEGSQLRTGIGASQVVRSTEVLTTNDVVIDAVGDIIIADGSAIANQVAELATGNSGNINIRAGGMLEINNALVSANTLGRGNAGNVNINVRSLSVSNGGEVTASTLDSGNGGNVTINAADVAAFDGIGGEEASSGSVAVTVARGAVGNGGKLLVNTGTLSVTNGATLVANTFGQGDAGDIEINASEVFINGAGTNNAGTVVGSGIGSQVFGDAVGNGGRIDITTDSLSVSSRGILAVAVAGTGDAGELKINATDTVSFDGLGTSGLTGAVSLVLSAGVGDGGTIAITAPSVILTNGAQLNTSTFGEGKGGNVLVNANSFVQSNGGRIRTRTRGAEQAGNITLNISSEYIIQGHIIQGGEEIESGLFATSERATGAGGNISIATDSLTVRDGAEISVSSDAEGNAGEISIAANGLRLDNGAIGAESANGRGGNISLPASESLILRRNSAISATAGTSESGGGDGGNITIFSGAIAALEDSDISANAFTGAGGNIRITTEGIFLSPDSTITASSQFGIDGTVEISRPDTDPSEGLIVFEEQVVDPEDLIAQDFCRQSRNSSFTRIGRGGLPGNPGDYLNGDNIRVSLISPVPSSTMGAKPLEISTEKIPDRPAEIVPARGWVMLPDGRVQLVAYQTPGIILRDDLPKDRGCHSRN
ncbi:MAG: filamentous hemagglutinin N-terminal domain-containing protein [Hormoscilla sp.]